MPEYLKALQGDAREELAMLTQPGLFGRRPLTEEMIYMRNPSEVLARAGEDGAGSVRGYSELTRSQFLNPKINQYIDEFGKNVQYHLSTEWVGFYHLIVLTEGSTYHKHLKILCL